ncbi:uncharacterized protein [Physcomitrium patens]|uniref:uncharacterized protein isoform X1 n=1 Tax=Physcomitrium patens TaxID=3218 RepID=UPI000D1575D2|nr:uncharacterized protein LOC112288303 isoform X1 [Physcomitrium patens]|eukprot:XP_024388139.1 uncharacterized protein LOC112288303 isoform X1 [Physcomitrella patens]
MPVPVALFWASWLSGSDVPSRKVLKQEGHYFRCELQEFCQYFASGADDHQPKGVEVASLAGRGDNKGDRLMGDGRTMENSSAGKAFIGWSYFVNGYRIFAGDSSKDICTLNVSEQVGFIFSALRVVRLCLYIYIYIYIYSVVCIPGTGFGYKLFELYLPKLPKHDYLTGMSALSSFNLESNLPVYRVEHT